MSYQGTINGRMSRHGNCAGLREVDFTKLQAQLDAAAVFHQQQHAALQRMTGGCTRCCWLGDSLAVCSDHSPAVRAAVEKS
jgi:hypothetical protein